MNYGTNLNEVLEYLVRYKYSFDRQMRDEKSQDSGFKIAES